MIYNIILYIYYLYIYCLYIYIVYIWDLMGVYTKLYSTSLTELHLFGEATISAAHMENICHVSRRPRLGKAGG